MKVSRGDVVLVNFPFASGTATKLRPAVVIQIDRNNQRLKSTILAAITTNTAHSRESTQVAIDVGSPDGRLTGLLQPSAIKCESLATVETQFVLRKIGSLSPALRVQLDGALKAALGLT